MVYLGGRRGSGFRRGRAIRLHDPPPGYRPTRMPSKDWQRMERQDRLLLRVGTVVLIPVAVAAVVLIAVAIAMHSQPRTLGVSGRRIHPCG
jgi:hypothetical protein